MSDTCLCPKCSDEKFDPNFCVFCQGALKNPEEGKLKGSSGARICIGCRDKCIKLLAKDDKKGELNEV